jgi:hypothetical protein
MIAALGTSWHAMALTFASQLRTEQPNILPMFGQPVECPLPVAVKGRTEHCTEHRKFAHKARNSATFASGMFGLFGNVRLDVRFSAKRRKPNEHEHTPLGVFGCSVRCPVVRAEGDRSRVLPRRVASRGRRAAIQQPLQKYGKGCRYAGR